MAIPDAAGTAIVRGMAAFMQSARRTDLPSALRPLQGKHAKMLAARKGLILESLEDEGLRALVVDWLKDKPSSISRADAEILEIVAAREDGWTERLGAAAPSPNRSDDDRAPKDLTRALEREKDKARKAKEEARRTKESVAKEIDTERKITASLRTEVAELHERVSRLEAELSAATEERDKAAAEMEREVRKARKRAEKAEAATEEAKRTASMLRKELAAAKTPVARPVRTATPKAVNKEPKRRARLPVPKGRYEDAPETLTEWLSAPNVHLLVDGYNVSKAEGGFGDLSLATQRDLLLQAVGKVARRHKIKATVVFDGSNIPPGTSRRARGPVEVEYSRADEIADDHLIARLEDLPRFPVVVATNDKELQGRAARLGATIATSNQLLALIR